MGLRPIQKDENWWGVLYSVVVWERRGRARTGVVEAVGVLDPERQMNPGMGRRRCPEGKRG